MNNDIKVSMIIPVYNVEKYLDECLESAVNQSFKDIEFIAINDGSTDKSLEILKKYQNKYSNFKIVNQENKGLSEARNTGLKEVRGEYIYFLDSDDYIDLDLVKNCYNEAKKNELDMVCFDAETFYDNKSYFENKDSYNYDRKETLRSEVISGREFYIECRTKNVFRSPVWLYFFRTDFIMNNKLTFYPKILHEDQLFTIQALLKCNKLKYIDKKLFFRRMREQSIMTSKKTIKNVNGYHRVAEELFKNLNNLDRNTKLYDILKNHIIAFYSSAISINMDIEEFDKNTHKIIRKSILNKKVLANKKLIVKLFLPRKMIIFIKKIKKNMLRRSCFES